MWIHVILDWLEAFFGNVVVWFGIAGVLLVIGTMISYRVRRKGERPVKKTDSSISEKTDSRKRIALITGASSGIGRAFTRRIDQTEKDIDEIWLVARRQDKLEEAAAGLQKPTRIIPVDLTEGLDGEIYRNILTETLAGTSRCRIGILVNAAGFAKIGNYRNVTFRDSMQMIDLNAKAAVAVTLACLPYMRRGDRIIQMCSTAAFQPLQHINIYGATKSLLYHYTRALRMELLPRGIAVTAVCPFWVKDTEFIGIAQNHEEKPPIKHFPFATTAEAVAKRGLRSSRAGWAVVTPGAFCVIHRIFTKVFPREVAVWIWEGMRRM